jgi:type II secretion system protein N
MKKWLLYSIYIIAVTGFFLYYLFPSEEVKKYAEFKISNTNPDMRVSIGKIKPVFPPGLGFYTVKLFREDNQLVEIEKLKTAPRLLSVFGAETLLSFSGDLYAGELKGSAAFAKDEDDFILPKNGIRQIKIDANLSRIHIKDIHAVKNLPDYTVSGILGGNILYDTGEDAANRAVAKIAVSDCNIGLPESGVKGNLALLLGNVSELNFSNIDADITIDKDNKLEIKQCILKGSQLNGEIAGTIDLRKPFKKSALNLTVTIKPHPSFIAAMGNIAASLFKKGSMSQRISGTIENPRIPFR